MIDSGDVLKIAALSRLALTGEEVRLYSGQLSAILEHVGKLKELDIQGVAPTSHVLDLRNVMREDRTSPCLPAEDVLANAPDREGDFYRVPRIIETA
ncbi:MAG: Asp-tRNA(Asn)/Glu-tRNA(Gln) amidotransferase subunit GatC [Nitrospiraceae bacterium]|nr:Asp-tRNA(Asn)/Glu-tRNA(Gln) amidotransferase subunit GatC [Nitrospiraceae bacterium]